MRTGEDQLPNVIPEIRGSVRGERDNSPESGVKVMEAPDRMKRLDSGLGQSAVFDPGAGAVLDQLIAGAEEDIQQPRDTPVEPGHNQEPAYRSVSLRDGAVYEALCDFCYIKSGYFFSVDDFREYLRQQGMLLNKATDASVEAYFSRRVEKIAAHLSAQYGSKFVSVPVNGKMVISEVPGGNAKRAAAKGPEPETNQTSREEELKDHSGEPLVIQPSVEDDEEVPLVDPMQDSDKRSHGVQDAAVKSEPVRKEEGEDVSLTRSGSAPVVPAGELKDESEEVVQESAPSSVSPENEDIEPVAERLTGSETKKKPRRSREHEAARVVYIEKVRKVCFKCLADYGGAMTRRDLVNLISSRQPKIHAFSYQIIDKIVGVLVEQGDLTSFEESRIEMIRVATPVTEEN